MMELIILLIVTHVIAFVAGAILAWRWAKRSATGAALQDAANKLTK